MDKLRHRRRSIQDTKGMSQEDWNIWHHITRNVTPLSHVHDHNKMDSEKELFDKTLASNTKQHSLFSSSLSSPLEYEPPKMSHGLAPGLDRRTEIRMRRGKVKAESQIDLHGMHRDEARYSLHRFLTISYAKGRKCVLVITGKGLACKGSVGVLRHLVPQWLNEMSAFVYAFHYAAPKDGGEGALYVMVRRKKRT